MEHFIQNKYSTWYFSLVNDRKNRILPNSVYKEKHHIVPKSLGGNDSADNLVKLTAREHYIAHLLLVKMFDGDNKMKMSFALRCMSNFQNKYHQRYTPPSKIYEIARKHAAIASSEKNTGHPNYNKFHTTETKEKLSIKAKERLSALTPEELSIRTKNSFSSPSSWTEERKKKISKSHIGKKLSVETRKKMSESKLNMTDEQKFKCGDSNRGKTWKLIDGKRMWFAKEN
jgi:hypothetical protein